MKNEFKTFELKIDGVDQGSGLIRGFASTFGNIDLGDDVVEPGAFKKTLKESKGVFPILYNHDPSQQLGWNIRAEETEKGLYVEGKINMKDSFAAGKYGLIQDALSLKAKMGLSIGYMTIKAIPDKERPSVRRLQELKLVEYSVVTFPMNTQAMVTDAKNFIQVEKKAALVSEIKRLSKECNVSIKDLILALQGGAADFDSYPDHLVQSLDEMINLFKKGE